MLSFTWVRSSHSPHEREKCSHWEGERTQGVRVKGFPRNGERRRREVEKVTLSEKSERMWLRRKRKKRMEPHCNFSRDCEFILHCNPNDSTSILSQMFFQLHFHPFALSRLLLLPLLLCEHDAGHSRSTQDDKEKGREGERRFAESRDNFVLNAACNFRVWKESSHTHTDEMSKRTVEEEGKENIEKWKRKYENICWCSRWWYKFTFSLSVKQVNVKQCTEVGGEYCRQFIEENASNENKVTHATLVDACRSIVMYFCTHKI